MEFSNDIIQAIGIYVYRLIDPRNGETFYVGKGKGNRVFQHAKGDFQEASESTENEEDAEDLKMRRINDIRNAGLEVIHVIHRHGIADDETAYQVEAALIDAYPGLSNRVSGRYSGDYGPRHALEIIREYSREEFTPKHDLILISVRRSLTEEGRSLLDAVRGVWRINKAKAEQFELVLAHSDGIVMGAFVPDIPWIPATVENFPWLEEDMPRWGFTGTDAPAEIASFYVGKRVPSRYRKKGAASPIRYVRKSAPDKVEEDD